MINFGKLLTKRTDEYNARVAAGTQEDFIQDLRNKKGDLGIPGATTSNTAPITSKDVAKTVPRVVDDVDTWQDVDTRPTGAPKLSSQIEREALEATKKIKQSEEAFGPRGKPVVTQQQLIDSGEVPPDYFDEKYMGKKGGRNQTEFQREDQSRALEKWRNESGQTDWRGNFIEPTVKRDKLISGDLWDQEGYKIVSTNLGGVHGRGLAKQAQTQGYITSANKSFVTSPKGGEVITLAVKGAAPETAKVPGKPFSEKTTGGNVKLMVSEVNKLIEFARKNPTKKFNMPFIGLGFGEGDPKVIKPILARVAKEPNIFLVSKDAATVAKHKSSFAPGVRSDSTSRPPAHLPKYPATDLELKKTRIAPKATDIVVSKSRVLSKESGVETLTTKGEKVKTAVKKGGTLLKGPGSTTLNALSAFTLISPLIGAFGAVVKEQKREEESQAAYPLHPPKQKTLWSRFANMKGKDFSQALMHRLAPEEIYGKEGYPSLKKVKEWRKNSKGYGT